MKNCPNDDNLRNHITEILSECDDDMITFSQWQTTDRCKLIMQTTPASDFEDVLVEALQKLTAHSYLARAQSEYLNKRKNEMDDKTALFFG